MAQVKATGEQVVVKQFKNHPPMEEEFWDRDVMAYERAEELAIRWNREHPTDRPLEVVIPKRAYIRAPDPARHFVVGEWVLVEEYIEGVYQKFNSNSGWVGDRRLSVQAFCHWTYHVSGGSELFCDAQGVRYLDGYRLTDPCIMSQKQIYGITDLGREGIVQWFSLHVCNEHCRAEWSRPRDAYVFLPVTKETKYSDAFLHTRKIGL